MNEISSRFIETYKSMNLTGYKMGKGSSVITKQKISNIENGKTDVSIDIIADFCKIYKSADVFYILTGYRQDAKETSVSPFVSEREIFYKEMLDLERADKERLRIEYKNELEALRREKDDEIRSLIVHEAELEQRLSLFTSEKSTAPRTGNVAGAVELKKTGTYGE